MLLTPDGMKLFHLYIIVHGSFVLRMRGHEHIHLGYQDTAHEIERQNVKNPRAGYSRNKQIRLTSISVYYAVIYGVKSDISSGSSKKAKPVKERNFKTFSNRDINQLSKTVISPGAIGQNKESLASICMGNYQGNL